MMALTDNIDRGVGPSSRPDLAPVSTGKQQATATAPQTAQDTSSAVEENGTAVGIPFENLVTLPWALYLQPLPHTSYLIRTLDSGTSSETSSVRVERADGGHNDSDIDSEASNYRAGLHRLERMDSSVPPHSLRTISLLLERTRCLDAVSIWARLFELLNAADDDPHFAKLRAFFDARYDRTGRLIQKDGRKSAGGLQRMRSASDTGSSLERSDSIQSQENRHHHSLRRQSNARQQAGSPPRLNKERSASASTNAATLLFRKRAASGAQRNEESSDAQSSSGGDEGNQADHGVPLRAPEISHVAQATGETRIARFKVRLDLHAVGLAPPPPSPPVAKRPARPQQQHSTIASRLASPPSRGTVASQEPASLQKVLSNSSSNDQAYADGISLYPVGSPDSYHSRRLSDGGGVIREELSPSADCELRRTARTHTVSGAGAGASMAAAKQSGLPLGSNGVDESMQIGVKDENTGLPRRSTFSKFGSFSSITDSKRRPSMLQKLKEFKGFRSKSNTSNNSTLDLTDEERQSTSSPIEPAGMPFGSRGESLGRTVSPSQAQAGRTASVPIRHARSTTDGSDYSNDEALDTGDEEGSVGSSYTPLGMRRPSGAGGLQNFRAGPELEPVQEGTVYTATSSDEGHGLEDSSAARKAEEAEMMEKFKNGGDLLALLRTAADTALTLQSASASTQQEQSSAASYQTNGELVTSPISTKHSDSIDDDATAQDDALFHPYQAEGTAGWWLSGAADPLPISIACGWSQGLGWNGIMDLCYGSGSQSEAKGKYQPLGKAAELDRLQQQEKKRVESWAKGIAGEDTALVNETDPFAPDSTIANDDGISRVNGDAVSDLVAPSESASAKMPADEEKAAAKSEGPVASLGKILKEKLRTGGNNTTPEPTASTPERRGSLFELEESQKIANATKGSSDSSRTWRDWAELFRSIARWVQDYETCRVRQGLAGEIGEGFGFFDKREGTSLAWQPESALVNQNSGLKKPRYTSRMSYKVPACVVKDAVNRQHGFRRYDGIPEGLPLGPNGEEVGDYRWSNKRLSRNHFATSATLGARSLSHVTSQLSMAEWPHASAWELDYLEMCVFKSPIVALRFPPAGESIVAPSQRLEVMPGDQAAAQRAMPCPLPDARGAWSAKVWREWLSDLRGGKIVVPAVSWQAWWTLIAILNGADGSGRPLDVQLKAEEETFDALVDPDVVFL